MNGKQDARQGVSASKRIKYITVLEIYVTILGTILGTIFAWSQLQVAQSEEERSHRAEPLAYTLEAVNTHYQYEISQDGKQLSIPAPSLRLRVTHGSLHSATAISFDGSSFYELSTLPMQDSWEGCLVDITLPPQSIIQDGDLIYDYFFLLLEPTEGQPKLDLICNTISLGSQKVNSSVSHAISLVQREFLPDGPQREMLTAYYTLHSKMMELGLFSG